MKKLFQLFLFVTLLSSIITAQTIYVADSMTDDFEPINADNYWEIPPWGRTLHVILDMENNTVEGDIVYLFVDKYSGGKYQPYDSKSVNIKKNQRRIYYDYKFTEPGKYKLYYINVSQQQLASVIVTVAERKSKQTKVIKRSNYYDNVKLIFCKKVLVGGTPMGITNRASLSENDGQIYVKITNFSPLKTDIILVDIWKKEHRSFEYDEYVESKKFKINPEWMDTFFKIKFKTPGDYRISIYNSEEVLVATGYITVSD